MKRIDSTNCADAAHCHAGAYVALLRSPFGEHRSLTTLWRALGDGRVRLRATCACGAVVADEDIDNCPMCTDIDCDGGDCTVCGRVAEGETF